MKKSILGGLLAAFLFCGHVFAADCARTSGPYTDGDVLYAASYESEENNQITCTNARVQDTGDTVTGNYNFNSGGVTRWFSDSGSTIKASINGSTGVALLGLPTQGQVINCGISNSGTTLTIAGYEGTALSATNPCIIGIRSNTAGRTAIAYFTANVTVTHGATSNTDGNLFGIVDANWGSTMPIFYGVVYDGTTPYWIIGRLPIDITGSAATALCQKDDTDCDSKLDQMILTTGLTLANWVNLPVTQLGWFDATYATASSAWTFAGTGRNGFNNLGCKTSFTMPTGQMGADSGKFFDAGATLTPAWATPASIDYQYSILCSGGLVCVDGSTEGAGNVTNGGASTAVTLQLPFTTNYSHSIHFPIGRYYATGSTSAVTDGQMGASLPASDDDCGILDQANNTLMSDDFSNTANDLSWNFCYRVY